MMLQAGETCGLAKGPPNFNFAETKNNTSILPKKNTHPQLGSVGRGGSPEGRLHLSEAPAAPPVGTPPSGALRSSSELPLPPLPAPSWVAWEAGHLAPAEPLSLPQNGDVE